MKGDLTRRSWKPLVSWNLQLTSNAFIAPSAKNAASQEMRGFNLIPQNEVLPIKENWLLSEVRTLSIQGRTSLSLPLRSRGGLGSGSEGPVSAPRSSPGVAECLGHVSELLVLLGLH